MSCRDDGKIDLNFRGLPAGFGQLFVDRRQVGSGNWTLINGVSSIHIDPVATGGILAAMRRGSRLDMQISGRSATFGLNGSSEAISSLLATCRSGSASQQFGSADQAFKRFPNEATMTFADPGDPFDVFQRTNNADISGGDIRNGLNDPLLRGMTERQCAALCQITGDCGAYTWNGRNGDVCFLKTGRGRMSRYRGAVSGVLSGEPTRLPPPPTRGPGPVIDERVTWRDGDTEESYTRRVREAAAPLGRSCEAERSDLASLAETLRFSLPQGTARVGETYAVEWSGNALIERIPVWVMVSTPSLVRFSGDGFFALGPEAPNPFGIAPGKGESRAMVALWARGAGTSGTIHLDPLRAGDMPVNIRLVAYLRACQQEVTLKEQTQAVRVSPAPAELVVGTPASRADLTHAFDVPKFDRRVELNETRLRISVISDGTEIIERAGKDVALSPTQRFLTIAQGATRDVIDLVDGKTIATSKAYITSWALGDSLYIASDFPYGQIYIRSTFSNSVQIDHGASGPSCCMAFSFDEKAPANVKGRMGYDIENGIVTVLGRDSGSSFPLQVPSYEFAVAASTGDRQIMTPGTRLRISPARDLALRSFGLVSPFTSLARTSETRASSGVDTDTRQYESDGQKLNPLEITAIRLNNREIDLEHIQHFSASSPTFDAETNLERLSIGISNNHLPPLVLKNDWASYLDGEPTLKRSEQFFRQLKNDTKAAGWNILWTTAQERFERSSCQHVGFSDYDIKTRNRDAALSLPREFSGAQRLQGDGKTVWVLSFACEYGGTLGSLGLVSAMLILDLSKPQPVTANQLVILTADQNGGKYLSERLFQSGHLKSSFTGSLLVISSSYTSGILVYDLDAGETLRMWRDLPSGDLLQDARLTEDGRHVVQMNSDGGFHVHRIDDGETVLHGRIVEDEVAVWTDDFQFDATAEAASRIDLRFPGLDGQFSLDRFEPVLYVPGLAQKVLGGDVIPPAQDLDVPPDISGTVTLEGGEIVANIAIDPSRGATQLRVYQDGVQTHYTPLTASPQGGLIRVPRLPGTRYAAIVAANENGLVSLPIHADLGLEIPGGIRRALAVGVDVYTDASLPDLNFAQYDADQIIGTLLELPATVPQFEEPVFLGGRRATPDNVLSAIDDLLDGLGASDHAVLFFAGHGVQDTDGAFYMAMHNTILTDLPNTALPWDAVAKRLAQTRARVTILIDACHAGAADGVAFATNDGAVSGLSSVPSNVTILAASKGRQLSIEAAKSGTGKGGGMFSVALRDVLVEKRHQYDKNGNGRIEASELADSVTNLVRQRTNGQQVPWMTKGRTVGDHAIF